MINTCSGLDILLNFWKQMRFTCGEVQVLNKEIKICTNIKKTHAAQLSWKASHVIQKNIFSCKNIFVLSTRRRFLNTTTLACSFQRTILVIEITFFTQNLLFRFVLKFPPKKYVKRQNNLILNLKKHFTLTMMSAKCTIHFKATLLDRSIILTRNLIMSMAKTAFAGLPTLELCRRACHLAVHTQAEE